MTKGLRIRRPNGVVVVDTTTPISFVIGSLTTGAGTDGTFLIPDVNAEKYYAFISGVVSDGKSYDDQYGASGGNLPAITVTGRTLAWKFPDGDESASIRASVIITYAGYSV